MDKEMIKDILENLLDGEVIEVSCCCQSQRTASANTGYMPSRC